MFNPLLNKQTGEVQCVGNRVEYYKLQYLKMSDSAQIWIPSWQNENKKNCKIKKVKMTKLLSSANAAKDVSKI